MDRGGQGVGRVYGYVCGDWVDGEGGAGGGFWEADGAGGGGGVRGSWVGVVGGKGLGWGRK